jgi:hypothetical protein
VPFQKSANATSLLAVWLVPTATQRDGPLQETASSRLASAMDPVGPGTRWPSQRRPSQASATGTVRPCAASVPTATQYRALAQETPVSTT